MKAATPPDIPDILPVGVAHAGSRGHGSSPGHLDRADVATDRSRAARWGSAGRQVDHAPRAPRDPRRGDAAACTMVAHITNAAVGGRHHDAPGKKIAWGKIEVPFR